MATSQTQGVVGQQEFDPWGKVRSGSMRATNVNYTGQRLDGTGLLYYHARLYDPLLGRFVSADSVVPGGASGAGGGAATLGVDGSSPLTVDVHEPGFVAAVNGENAFRAQKGFWFQLSDDDKQQAKSPWGPINPQALNRYSYVLNNPLRYTDPTGHTWYLGQQETNDLIALLTRLKNDSNFISLLQTNGALAATGIAELAAQSGLTTAAADAAAMLGLAFAAALGAGAITVAGFAYHIDQIISWLNQYNGEYGVAIATDELGRGLYILDRTRGRGVYYQPGILFWNLFANVPSSMRLGATPHILDAKHPYWWNSYYWSQDDIFVVHYQPKKK